MNNSHHKPPDPPSPKMSDTPATVIPSPTTSPGSDHLSPYIERIEECTCELNELRAQIEECVGLRKHVDPKVKQKAYDCLAALRQLQTTMKQHNAVHRESKRIVRRSGLQETKYGQTCSRSMLTTPKSSPGWFPSPQISALATRVNDRVRRARDKFRSKERTSPL